MSFSSQAEVHTPRPEISVLPQSEVTADRPVRIMDMATVSFVSQSETTTALNLVVLPAIADGEIKKFKNLDLVKLLRAKIGATAEIAEEKWTYFVPEEVEIKGRKNLLSPQSVQNQITMAIQSPLLGIAK